MNVELNSNGVNKKIKAHILSDDEMREIGFSKNYYEGPNYEEYSPYWWFSKTIKFPKEKQYRGFEIDFDVKIPKDGSDIRIDVLDMDFCQPFDYQYYLNKNPKHKTSLIIKEQVEEWMDYLQEKGVLSGHEYGEYI